MEKLIIIFAALLISLAATATEKQRYDVKEATVKTRPGQPGLLVSGWIGKGSSQVQVKGIVTKLAYMGRLDVDKTPIHCTSSTCALEDFQFFKIDSTAPMSERWKGAVIANLVVDQNSDGKSEWEEAHNIGLVDDQGLISMPDVRFSYIEQKFSLSQIFSDKKDLIIGVYDAR